MAIQTPIMRLLENEDYIVNGVSTMRWQDADVTIGNAHAVLSFVTSVAGETGDFGRIAPSDGVVIGALRAAQQLVEIGLWQLQQERLADVRQRAAA